MKYLKQKLQILILALGITSSALAQDYILPINLGLRQGNVSFTATPFDIGGISNVFDGNEDALARSANVNPLVITLQFTHTIPLVRSRILAGNPAAWTLEVANSLSDLENQAGSYRNIVSDKPIESNVWDQAEASFIPEVKVVRLSLERTQGDNFVHLREWQLYAPLPSYDSVTICPASYYLTPGLKKQFKLVGTNSYGFKTPIEDAIHWTSMDTNVAVVDTTGLVTAKAEGEVTLYGSYSETAHEATLTVGNSFTPVRADRKKVKVAVILENPYIPGSDTLRWNDRFGWNDPKTLAADLVREMNAASDHTVEFQLTHTLQGDLRFTYFDGQPVDTGFFYHRYMTKAGTDSLLYWAGHLSRRLQYNYAAMLDYYNFCEQREAGLVDEVWVFSHPAAAMHESTLAGQHAFPYNSSPVLGTSCIKLLPIMGFNNAVSVDFAMHSIGHRAEATMAQVYGGWQPDSDPAITPFDLYTRIDRSHPGRSQVGNIHYTPNAPDEYIYWSDTLVRSYAENWRNYPLMDTLSALVNCNTWECSQLGYMRWWFGHLPRYKGITDGVLNDWWHYIVHYEDAVALARAFDPGCGNVVVSGVVTAVANTDRLVNSTSVVPNPSMGLLRVSLPDGAQKASFALYDPQGRIVYNKELQGQHSQLDLSTAHKGIYVYRITMDQGTKPQLGKIILE